MFNDIRLPQIMHLKIFPCSSLYDHVCDLIFIGNHNHAETMVSPSCLCANYLPDVHLTGSAIQVRPPTLLFEV